MIGKNSLTYDLCNGSKVCTTLHCIAETIQDLRSIQTILLSKENIARYEVQFGALVVREREEFPLPEAIKGFWQEFFDFTLPKSKRNSFDGISYGLHTTTMVDNL